MTISERADQTVYVCQECGCVITDQHKDKMLRFGRWQIVRESNVVHRRVGFWINTLYSPFVRFSEVALEFMSSRNDPERLQNFVNSWLAEPWEDEQLKVSAEMVLDRQTTLPEFQVPKWARMLTGGVDVQETTMFWTIRAWGNYITSQNICHGQVTSWSDIARIMNTTYQKEDGEQMVVSLCLIDSGYDADGTYDFCADNSDWALPVKGSSHNMMSHFRLSKINKSGSRAFGMNLVLVDGNKYKDMIAARIKKENGSGSWMVYDGCDIEYAEQITSEHKVNVKTGSRVSQRWVPKRTHHVENHYLDCCVYAFAAADILGVRSMHLDDPAESKETKQPERPNQESSPEENWIAVNEKWV